MKTKLITLACILCLIQSAHAYNAAVTVGNTLETPIGNLSIGVNPALWNKKVAIALLVAMIAIPIIIKTTPWVALHSRYLKAHMAYDDHGKRKPGFLWRTLEKLQLPFKVNANITL